MLGSIPGRGGNCEAFRKIERRVGRNCFGTEHVVFGTNVKFKHPLQRERRKGRRGCYGKQIIKTMFFFNVTEM